MVTGTARTRARGTSPLTVVCRPSHSFNQTRPRVSSRHRSHMAVVEAIWLWGAATIAIVRPWQGKLRPHHSWHRRGNRSRNPTEQQTCYVCHSVGHLSYNCPNRPSGSSDKSSSQTTSGRAQVNCCDTVQRMPECDMGVAAKECAVSIGESVCESVCERRDLSRPYGGLSTWTW